MLRATGIRAFVGRGCRTCLFADRMIGRDSGFSVQGWVVHILSPRRGRDACRVSRVRCVYSLGFTCGCLFFLYNGNDWSTISPLLAGAGTLRAQTTDNSSSAWRPATTRGWLQCYNPVAYHQPQLTPCAWGRISVLYSPLLLIVASSGVCDPITEDRTMSLRMTHGK